MSSTLPSCLILSTPIVKSCCRAAVNDFENVGQDGSRICFRRQCRAKVREGTEFCSVHQKTRKVYVPSEEETEKTVIAKILQLQEKESKIIQDGDNNELFSYFDKLVADFRTSFFKTMSTRLVSFLMTEMETLLKKVSAKIESERALNGKIATEMEDQVSKLETWLEKHLKEMQQRAEKVKNMEEDSNKKLQEATQTGSEFEGKYQEILQEKSLLKQEFVAFLHATMSEFYDELQKSSLVSQENMLASIQAVQKTIEIEEKSEDNRMMKLESFVKKLLVQQAQSKKKEEVKKNQETLPPPSPTSENYVASSEGSPGSGGGSDGSSQETYMTNKQAKIHFSSNGNKRYVDITNSKGNKLRIFKTKEIFDKESGKTPEERTPGYIARGKNANNFKFKA